MTIPNHFPSLPAFKPPLYLKQFADRIGVADGYLIYLGQIVEKSQASGVRLSTPTVDVLTAMLTSGYVNATTDDEESKIEDSIAELKSLLDGENKRLWHDLIAMDKHHFNSIVEEVIATVKAGGWQLIRRRESVSPVGTSIYLNYTTDGQPSDPDYQWDIHHPTGPYEPFYEEHIGDSPETFRFDPRHCKLRISNHGSGGPDIGVSIVVSLTSATCKILNGRRHEFKLGWFEEIFDRHINSKFNPRIK